MNDGEFEALRHRLLAVLERWRSPLGLNWWRLTYEYDRTGQDLRLPESSPAGLKTFVAAETTPDWKYLHATILFNMPKLQEADDEYMEYIVVHELMHVLLHETREGRSEDGWLHEERVATTLAHAFIWTRQAGATDAEDKAEHLDVPDLGFQELRMAANGATANASG